ncbi:MAG TPA: hypothetical protein PLB47_10410, partial [Solirubrobacterales bacterium]|nr:hypothetical protein [Solirubrobacterales bacterium]
TFCQNGNCFDRGYPNDTDFAKSMALMEAAREAGGANDSAANSATAIVAPRAIRAGKMPIPRASQSGRPSPVRSSERCMPVCKPANRLVVSGQHGNIPDRGGVSLPAGCG